MHRHNLSTLHVIPLYPLSLLFLFWNRTTVASPYPPAGAIIIKKMGHIKGLELYSTFFIAGDEDSAPYTELN
jgi:hypothetical protein